MTTRVLFFGATADIVGARELAFDAEGRSATELLQMIVGAHPRLSSHRLLISVNQEFASNETRVDDGDEVAIFTAVSGG